MYSFPFFASELHCYLIMCMDYVDTCILDTNKKHFVCVLELEGQVSSLENFVLTPFTTQSFKSGIS